MKMLNYKPFFISILFLCASATALRAQVEDQALVSHQEFMSYYNPSILNSGTQASLSFLHRNQWEGVGPINNLLYFERAFLGGKNGFAPKGWGVFVQQQEFSVYKWNGASAMYAGQVIASKYESINFGINLGMNMSTLNRDDFDPLELSDPEIAGISDEWMMSGRFGLSYQRRLLQVGVASGFNHENSYTDLHAFVKKGFELRNLDFVMTPMLLVRASENFDMQFEGQFRTQYKQIVNVTLGYRQDFGMLFQLGLALSGGQLRGSFGHEVPNQNTEGLGSSQEVLLGLSWETLASKKRTKEIEMQREKDSIRFARRDSIRAARLLIMQQKQAEDSLAALATMNDTIESQSDVIRFDEVSLIDNKIHDNTHVIMDHIRFEKGQDIISADSFEQLDRLAAYLKHHHHFKIEIQGHSDNYGDYMENIDLSERRALAVTNYVLSRGISRERIELRGYGPDRPLVPNTSEENRSMNRRVEIVFHTIDKKEE